MPLSKILSGSLASGVGGKVLQVITATDNTQRGTTSTSFVTGSNTLSVSITPSSTSNKILIIVTSNVYNDGSNSNFTIYRGATNLGDATTGIQYCGVGTAANAISMHYLDSPSTTSATTYQVYFRRTGGSGTVYIQGENSRGSITCLEIAG